MAAGGVDDRLEVLHLAGDGVRASASAVTAPAPVVVEDGVVLGEPGGQLDVRAEGAAAEGPVDEYHGRPAAGPVIGDGGPVTRDCRREPVRGRDRGADLNVMSVVGHGWSFLWRPPEVAGRGREVHVLDAGRGR